MELESIKGIGIKTAKLLNKVGIFTSKDLLEYYPYRYQFYEIVNINNASLEEEIVVNGSIASNPLVSYIKKNFNRISFRAIVNNNLINVVIFNRAFMKNLLTIGKNINLIGKYDKNKNTFICSNISFDEIIGTKIEPKYHLINGLHNKQISTSINSLLDIKEELEDNIPVYLNKSYKLITKNEALNYIHRPNNSEEIKKAKLKLIYEELFAFMFKINYLKTKTKNEPGIKRDIDIELINKLIDSLPFSLTNDQLNSLNDILNDMSNDKRMNRLLLGDVGSGKTIVAILASYANYLCGYQTAFMAPTEILAIQHYHNIVNTLKGTNIKVELLVGSKTKKEKNLIAEKIKNNEIDLVIGTHAIISSNIIFSNLGLVITDEQHRFGVNQRSNLQNKGNRVDVIYMSATPIPRTYALTLYGDMDISMIKEKPKGRKEIDTLLKKESEIKEVLELMLEEIKLNHQIYIVAPMIEENENFDLKTVTTLKEKIDLAYNHKIPIEIIHGKLKAIDKKNVMDRFVNNEIKILISTTIVEVGVDNKNATMMVIFNAERFGLATLHQLRGRIGRSDLQSKCILISDKETKRLQVMCESNDGFYISEKDFELRGEGDLFGVKQSGDMSFKIASLKRDLKILMQTKEDSEIFIKENKKDNFNNYPYYNKLASSLDFID